MMRDMLKLSSHYALIGFLCFVQRLYSVYVRSTHIALYYYSAIKCTMLGRELRVIRNPTDRYIICASSIGFGFGSAVRRWRWWLQYRKTIARFILW